MAGRLVTRSSRSTRLHGPGRRGPPDRRPHRRIGVRTRQTPPDRLFRRPRAAHAHADERQLAHLPRRAVAAGRAHARAGLHGRRMRRRLQRTDRGAAVDPRLARHQQLRPLGPDLLGPRSIRDGSSAVLRARHRNPIADVLLDQRVVAGIGNVFKSEILVLAGAPSVRAAWRRWPMPISNRIVSISRELRGQRHGPAQTLTRIRGRRTTRSLDPDAKLWMHTRGGNPAGAARSIRRRSREPTPGSPTDCPVCQRPLRHAKTLPLSTAHYLSGVSHYSFPGNATTEKVSYDGLAFLGIFVFECVRRCRVVPARAAGAAGLVSRGRPARSAARGRVGHRQETTDLARLPVAVLGDASLWAS